MKYILILLFLLLSTDIYADKSNSSKTTKAKQAKQSVNLSPISTAIGIYALNYMYLHKGTHGLALEYNFYRPNFNTEFSKFEGMNFSAAYRWHWSNQQDSGFLGTEIEYGNYTTTIDGVKQENNALNILFSIGERWMLSDAINLTFKFGIGQTLSGETRLVNSEAKQDQSGTLSLDGELSIGYCF